MRPPEQERSRSSPISAPCIACNQEAQKRGEIPFSYHFLNATFSEPLDTGDLYECSTCGLWFKYPYLSESTTTEYYKSSPDTISWGDGKPREDFNTVGAFLEKSFPEGGEILDVGCYRGKFLSQLPNTFSKKGIELSKLAADGAHQAGVEIIGGGVEALKESDLQFQAVTLFDVFEHLTDPLGTLDILFSRLRPGGALCIVTGTADFWLFRLVGPLFYYSCMPEHVCFITEKFGRFLAARYQASYSYSTLQRTALDARSKIWAIAIDAINAPMLILRRKRRISRFFFSHRLKVINSRGLRPLGSNDHALVVLRKPGP
jgi:SAM-dependent methyltransferase